MKIYIWFFNILIPSRWSHITTNKNTKNTMIMLTLTNSEGKNSHKVITKITFSSKRQHPWYEKTFKNLKSWPEKLLFRVFLFCSNCWEYCVSLHSLSQEKSNWLMCRQKVVSWADWKNTFLEHSTYSQKNIKKPMSVTTLELSSLQRVSLLMIWIQSWIIDFFLPAKSPYRISWI